MKIIKAAPALLNRYDRNADGSYIINTKINNCNSLFNEFDFASSFWNRDLREEFVEYLVDCVDEIGNRNKFILQLSLPEDEKEDGFYKKFKKALSSYFMYLVRDSKKSIKKYLNKIILNFIISISLLVLIFITDKKFGNTDTIIYMIFSEGLSIAIWVLLWPVFSEFLFDIKEEFHKIKIYKRVMDAKLVINYFI